MPVLQTNIDHHLPEKKEMLRCVHLEDVRFSTSSQVVIKVNMQCVFKWSSGRLLSSAIWRVGTVDRGLVRVARTNSQRLKFSLSFGNLDNRMFVK